MDLAVHSSHSGRGDTLRVLEPAMFNIFSLLQQKKHSQGPLCLTCLLKYISLAALAVHWECRAVAHGGGGS